MARSLGSWRRLLGGAVFALALIPGAALAAGTLDQQQTETNGSTLLIAEYQSLAQTFTAGFTGSLDQVDLHVAQFGDQSLFVEIRGVDGVGQPTGNVLASEVVAAEDVSLSGGWVSVPLTPPVGVVANEQYAIVAHSSGRYGWGFSSENPYLRGSYFRSSASPPATWSSNPETDLAFKTYVTPVPTCGGLESTLTGTPGNDTLTGTSGVDIIVGLGGNDTIKGGSGNDVICGGDGTDTIDGGSGADKLYGDAGNDTLKGGSGNDTLDGGSGADQVNGGSDKDNLVGGSGSPDKCDGGSGTDSGGSGCESRKSIP